MLASLLRMHDAGGINGRRITFLSLDDGYVPAKTVEQVRKLIEQDQVFALFQNIGSASNAAIQKYTNAKKVPVIFVGSVSEKIADPANYPWTMPWNPIRPRPRTAAFTGSGCSATDPTRSWRSCSRTTTWGRTTRAG
jgi:branched-chain amino acid transport system substrate-binding protein